MKNIIIVPLIILMLFFCSCDENSVEPIDMDEPIADAGTEQTINLGSYFILDGTKSIKGNGASLSYTWTQDANNPEEVFIWGDSIMYQAVKTAGTYKYTLTVNNGIKKSKPAEIIITVNQRSSMLITDIILEAEIRFLLKKQTGYLTTEDLLSIDSIYVGRGLYRKSRVYSVLGLENCTNLRVLIASLQTIADLTPLSNLKKLTRLQLDQNYRLKDISPLANLTQLKYLDIFCTGVLSISELKNLINLEYINICMAPITNISVVSNFTKLKEFWAFDLPITDLSVFSNLSELELLYIAGGNIKDISALQNLSKLKYINLWENKVEDIKPLVDNSSFTGSERCVELDDNPLNDASINEYIPALQARGVFVYW